MNAPTARLFAVAWLLAVWTHFLVPGFACEPEKNAPDEAVLESFPFEPDEDLVRVPVRVGEKDHPFIVDTGATLSFFDTSFRSHLGPRIDSGPTRAASGKDVEMDRHQPCDARVGSLSLPLGPVLCHDFTLFREASGCDVRGIVGMDVLKSWIVRIDFDAGRFEILRPGTKSKPDWGECVSFVLDRNDMMHLLAAAGDNPRVPFQIDTGCNGTGSLENAFLARLVGADKARISGRTEGWDISGRITNDSARLGQLSVGAFRHENLRFNGGPTNVLGLGYLSRYRVTIDFPNERLYLAKGKRHSDPDHGPMCGTVSLFRGGRLEIEAVKENSPAYAAGVRPKDAIVELCGKPVAQWKAAELNRLFMTEGRTVSMVVERDGKRMEFNVVLKEFD